MCASFTKNIKLQTLSLAVRWSENRKRSTDIMCWRKFGWKFNDPKAITKDKVEPWKVERNKLKKKVKSEKTKLNIKKFKKLKK